MEIFVFLNRVNICFIGFKKCYGREIYVIMFWKYKVLCKNKGLLYVEFWVVLKGETFVLRKSIKFIIYLVFLSVFFILNCFGLEKVVFLKFIFFFL